MPGTWKPSTNELTGGRRLVVFADPNDENSNIFLLYTPLAADYTSLGSFGNIDYVANTVLPTCGGDRSSCSLAVDGIEGKLIEQKTVRGSYIYDYTIRQTGQPTRHLLSLFTVKLEAGRGKELVTLTAQCEEGRHKDLAATFDQVITSWKAAA